MDPKPYTTDSSHLVWTCPWFRIRKDEVHLPDGTRGTFEIIEKPPAVAVLPLTTDEKIVMISQYRYAVDDVCIEVPAGGKKSEDSIEETAKAELHEEVGGVAESLEFKGKFYLSNGNMDEQCHIYLARGVTLGETEREPLEVMQMHLHSIDEVYAMLDAGEILDAPTALVLYVCRKELQENC